ncbi:type II toxin-antitoxin system prevent-host-death family antitoxin [Thiohalophilus sp.]|uniref:type II toxin-antitoxin system Phd/YefM family antitoxin n=1 Tax=Thiohalophilus sp. TaxID=3028392 RepID=UPI002ACE0567|nr:type II toxin-antitoxin system prevent-host-death family antitoxin [Thiohalophilus sp.]MDZ7662834.1 type II toxin-antitoxin system prevent-host-death family antitoxin [Thiohalophilus sp.]
MTTVNVRDARERFAQLLDEVAAGEEIIILRRGVPAARLVGMVAKSVSFPDRRQLRETLPPMETTAAEAVRELRDQERY